MATYAIPQHILIIDLNEFDIYGKYLLFNPLNKSLVELEDFEYRLLLTKSSSEPYKQKLISKIEATELFEHCYVNDSSKVFSRIVILPTLSCNKNCKYCYHGGSKALSMEINDVPIVASYIEAFIQEKKPEKVSIIWHGGEPLIYLQIMCEISTLLQRYCSINGILYEESLLTNGLLLTEEVVRYLIERTGINEIQISIDQNNTPEDLRLILSAIKMFLEADIMVFIKYNIEEESFRNIYAILDIFSKLSHYDNVYFRLGYLESHGPIHTKLSMNYIDFVDKHWKLGDYLREKGLGWEPELPETLFSACVANDRNAITIGPDLFTYRCNVNVLDDQSKIQNIRTGELVPSHARSEEVVFNYNPFKDPSCMVCPCMKLLSKQPRKNLKIFYLIFFLNKSAQRVTISSEYRIYTDINN